MSVSTNAKFYNNTVKNNYFRKGFINIDEDELSSGNFEIYDSVIANNTGEYGPAVYIGYMAKLTGSRFNSTNTLYIGNRATKYGGAIYSMGPYNNIYVNFTDSTFIDNHALLGDIIHSYSRESLPYFSNLKELEAIAGAITTNPTKLLLDKESITKISLYSGDMIPSNIASNLYDDYGRRMYLIIR
ncbi:hypothetical protein PIROE2DRAFT_19288 [Piromyces sp. E2]|nr:hypothetical protein PIROE2DRAFT_19288 [Piromyces sp. E2]|eukprot:OUM56206.1 hypothetical protein PIROE2DRAFT_19288 [Piromyces sp. E2]